MSRVLEKYKNQIFQLIKTNKNFNSFNCLACFAIKDVISVNVLFAEKRYRKSNKNKEKKILNKLFEYSFKCDINMRAPLSTSSLIT